MSIENRIETINKEIDMIEDNDELTDEELGRYNGLVKRKMLLCRKKYGNILGQLIFSFV